MTFYSNQSRKLQEQFDTVRLADQLERTRKHARLSAEDRKIIDNAAFFFIATADADGCPDCSIKGGNPGFVTCVSDTALAFPNYDGNGMFRSLGNIHSNPSVGLLFVEFGKHPKKLRINGRAFFEHQDTSDPASITVKVAIEAIFPNCPRYMPKVEKTGNSVYNPAPGYAPPDPFWKSKPDLKPFLPKTGPETQKD
jgi:predicted pyridoxine 5'-phosphate oxidase superfamily flavin-nucleotide-binding protein